MDKNFTYRLQQFCSCIIMMLSLAWLTISIPFVYNHQEQLIEHNINIDFSPEIDEETNPFANTTEEKTESGGNTLSEFLHAMHLHMQHVVVLEKYSKCHPSDLYYAFHPELITPPPDFPLS